MDHPSLKRIMKMKSLHDDMIHMQRRGNPPSILTSLGERSSHPLFRVGHSINGRWKRKNRWAAGGLPERNAASAGSDVSEPFKDR